MSLFDWIDNKTRNWRWYDFGLLKICVAAFAGSGRFMASIADAGLDGLWHDISHCLYRAFVPCVCAEAELTAMGQCQRGNVAGGFVS